MKTNETFQILCYDFCQLKREDVFLLPPATPHMFPSQKILQKIGDPWSCKEAEEVTLFQ